jgi:lipoprotein-anchoring transpeptidase ErfK/SrfK
MKLLIGFMLLFAASPIWPLGPNPIAGDPFIIVNKKTNELAFIDDSKIQKIYRIASGAGPELTPEGEFTVVVKAMNPYYRRKNIPGGSPKNPLGTRWIGFDAENTDGRMYGIHGTNNPYSIGYYLTQGCVRMNNHEVEELFTKIPLGTKVMIVKSNESFETLAKKAGAIVPDL